MAQPDRNSQKEKQPRGKEPSFNWRGVILIAIAFALIGLAVLFRSGTYANFEEVPYPRFLELLENKQIVNDKNYPLQLVYQEGQPTQTLRALTSSKPSDRTRRSKSSFALWSRSTTRQTFRKNSA